MTKFYRYLLFAGLLAGTLDALGAIINFLCRGGKDITRIFRYIASAVFGSTAYTSGQAMVLLGIFFHYFIACGFTLIFFLFYPRAAILSANKWVGGFLYGILIWLVMNLAVVPLTHVRKFSTPASQVVIGMGILILAIGIPVSLIATSYYKRRKAGI